MSVVVSEPGAEDLAGAGTRLRFPVRVGDADRSVRIDLPVPAAVPSASALVPPALLVAMRENVPLVVEAEVSARLVSNLPLAQSILHAWDRSFSVVPVEVPRTVSDGPRAGAQAAFFTAGVDSFTAAIDQAGSIDRLVYVRGFEDFPDEDVAALVFADVERSAEALGTPLAVIDSDLRRLTDPSLPWFWAHGACLASTAIAFGAGRMLIGSTASYANMRPNGSHPMLDPLWSTERVDLVHHGAGMTRGEKVQRIGRHPAVQLGLRSCYEFRRPELNCQRCGKCLHTMVALQIAGALDGSRTFTRRLTLWDVALMETTDNPFRADYLPEYLDLARRKGSSLGFRTALHVASIRLHAALPLRSWIDRHPRLRAPMGRLVHAMARLVPGR